MYLLILIEDADDKILRWNIYILKLYLESYIFRVSVETASDKIFEVFTVLPL